MYIPAFLVNESVSAIVRFKAVSYRHNRERDDPIARQEAILRHSIWNCADIQYKSFEFAWLKPHSGDYDVTEAYAWLDEVLAAE